MNHARLLFLAPMALSFVVIAAVSIFVAGLGDRAQAWDGKVVKVVDGDTIDVKLGDEVKRIRLLGANCPESRANAKCRSDEAHGGLSCAAQREGGKRATARMLELAPIGKTVSVELIRPKLDRYGRSLAYVRSGNVDVGAQVIREGLCAHFTRYPHPREAEYAEIPGAKQED